MGVNITVPLRNRVAQAGHQARSRRWSIARHQMRLQQALHADPHPGGEWAVCTGQRPGAGKVTAAQAGRDYAAQSLDAEQKKYKLGASTSANVLQQQRNMANSEATLISATAAYAKDRAALLQLLSNTLDRYGINIQDAATGSVTTAPVIPGLTAPTAPARGEADFDGGSAGKAGSSRTFR